jgi:hypothetical protein
LEKRIQQLKNAAFLVLSNTVPGIDLPGLQNMEQATPLKVVAIFLFCLFKAWIDWHAVILLHKYY